jgi:hypothetical protein
MELQLVILHEFFAGVRLQPVFNQINAIESCVFVFPFFCLCDLAETLFQRMEGSRHRSHEWTWKGELHEGTGGAIFVEQQLGW